MSIFGSLEIGKRALCAQFKAMEVSGHNVANANTPGYSRQRVDLKTVAPLAVSGVKNSGGGVEVAGIQRIRSEFYHKQIINTVAHRSHWEMRREVYDAVEAIFMEPSEYGLNQSMMDFFDAWHELSSAPESMAVRMGLRERAITFTRAVRDIYMRFADLRLNMQSEYDMGARQLNSLAREVASINEKIIYLTSLQESSNDLLDQLDRALQEMADLADIRIFRKSNGAVEVFAGERLVVQDQHYFPVQVEISSEGHFYLAEQTGQSLNLSAGRLYGLQQAINEDIPGIQKHLDELVSALVEEVNMLHRSGYGLNNETGQDFFQAIQDNGIPPALQFYMSEALTDDVSAIGAASEPDLPGDGGTALEIARLRSAPIMEGGTVSVTDSYRGLITFIGVESQESERMIQAFSRTEAQLLEQDRSISSVNLDEEMLNMIQYQHAWNAAARFINYVDLMIGTLFQELGR